MTPNEAILELEDTYEPKTPLTDKQTDKYRRFLGKFNPDDITKIIEKSIEESRYLPRISQLNDAAKDLNVNQPDRQRGADKDCQMCSGTSWRYVTVMSKYTHTETQAVIRCGCLSDPGPGGVF